MHVLSMNNFFILRVLNKTECFENDIVLNSSQQVLHFSGGKFEFSAVNGVLGQ